MRDHDTKTSKMSKQSNEEDHIWTWYTFIHKAWFQGNITNTTTNNTDNITSNCWTSWFENISNVGECNIQWALFWIPLC